MQVFNTSFTSHSNERTEVTDISELVRGAVLQSSISDGIALVTTLHTTCSLFINEFQPALIEDFEALLERVVPERSGFYRHNDCRVSDCERGNAHSHLRAALLGQCITVGVSNRERINLVLWS
jgi:secondary thiamine-phosphate synthase enzyme